MKQKDDFNEGKIVTYEFPNGPEIQVKPEKDTI